MSRKRYLLGLSAALALGLAACGGDTTGTGDPLTEAEAAELAEAIAAGGFYGFTPQGAAPMGAPGQTAENIEYTINNESYPCNGGGSGTVTLNGTMSININDQTGAGTIGFDYTVTPDGCEVETSGGKVFTLDGDPNVKVSGDFTWSQTSVEGSLNYKGGFAWASDDRSGTCGVDLEANFNFDDTGSGSATVSGSVCGVDVNRTVTVEA